MRNPTTTDFGTVPQKFLFRFNWPLFRPAAGLTPETSIQNPVSVTNIKTEGGGVFATGVPPKLKKR
jgi:hypothetical protein